MKSSEYSGIIITGLSAAVALYFWGMNVWGGWAEKLFHKIGAASPAWFWLRLLHIETTEKNCVQFIKGISIVGITAVP